MSELLALVDGVVGQAAPGESIEAYAASGTENEIRVYDGAVESLSSASSAGIGVRVLLDGPEGTKTGFAWTGSLEEAAIERALRDARENARFASPDPHVALAEPDGVAAAAIELRGSGFDTRSIDDKIAMALDLEQRTREGDAQIRQVDSADYGDTSVEMAIASTNGVRAETSRTAAYLSVAALAGTGEETQTGSGLSVGRSPMDLDPALAASQAVERSVRMLGATKASSARTTVVFDPRVTSTILSVLGSALSGEAVVKGRSFFEGRIGEAVAVSEVTLVDDPTDVHAFGAAVLDGEGLACRRNVLIEDGILTQFVYDTTSARRASTSSTGSAVRGGYAGTPGAGCRALVLSPGSMAPADVLSLVGDGIYVQSITGVHSGVSPVSGDFSVGAEGLVIRDGALAEPVREFTIASTLQRMLQGIVAVGADLQWLPGVAAGQTLAIQDLQVSGS